MSSWTWPITGDIHYFTRGGDHQYSPSGVLRSMALFIDGVQSDECSIEAIVGYPEDKGWSGMVAVYYDKPGGHGRAT